MTSRVGVSSLLFLDGLVDGLACGRGSDLERLGSGAGDRALEDMRWRSSSALTGLRTCGIGPVDRGGAGGKTLEEESVGGGAEAMADGKSVDDGKNG